MAEAPWLTIVGLGEDGLEGLPPASRDALDRAEIVMGAERHLELLPDIGARGIPWPRPFADGIPELLGYRGRRVAMLASGNPFWFGAGTSLCRLLGPEEWTAFPAPSCFSLAASRLGWAIETVTCLGLHAGPLSRVRRHLSPGSRLIVTLRDGNEVHDFCQVLGNAQAGTSRLWVLEALGGPRERIRSFTASEPDPHDVRHPVCVAVDVKLAGPGRTVASGQADDLFEHDGQITKRPVRALALSALAPRPGELLWDLGAGSGSVGLEWMLSHPSMKAVAVERDAERAERIARNAKALGVDQLDIVHGMSEQSIEMLPAPDAVFIGGGLTCSLLDRLVEAVPSGVRLVAHGVTLETEALLTVAQERFGGELLRIELAQAAPLGEASRLDVGLSGGPVGSGTVIVAGFGFRSGASVASLQDALRRTGAQAPSVMAMPARKAETALALAVSEAVGLSVLGISDRSLQEQSTWTQSLAAQRRFGTGSVAEAAALAGAGPGAVLLAPRVISADRMATCALAQGASE